MTKIEKFFRDPTAFFRDAAQNRRASVRTGTPTYVVGFSTWKQYMRKFFPDRNLTFLPREISEHEFNLVWKKKILLDKTSEIFIWGFKAPAFILNFIKKNNVKVVFIEDGFVRSIQLGASKAPPMSLCLDTRTPYFNSQQPSDLEVLLNEYDFAADSDLLGRAARAIKLLVDSGVSKYNNAAPVDIVRIYGPKTAKRILVIGQVEDDASIQFGCEQTLTNNDVVQLAVKENPGAQIIYKPHPDVLEGHRSLRSDPDDVADIAQILTQKIPMAQALATIDHVYTITSLAGFEALLRGIKVTALGAPFYSGWGLTDDRQVTSRRMRKLELTQLFAGAYLLYPRYFDPNSGAKRELEDTIAQIRADYKKAPSMPALGLESAGAGAASTQVKTPRPDIIPTYLLGDLNYKSLLGCWFDERKFSHIPSATTENEFVGKFKKGLDANTYADFFVAGDSCAPYLKKYIESSGKKITYLTEGFIRSVELDTKKALPYSLLLDRRAPHYDSRRPTDLEELLNGYDFDADAALMERARLLLEKFLQSGLSKYNHVAGISDLEAIYGVKDKIRVLVLGQIEDAASLKLANPRNYTNNDLVTIAAMENPGAQIIFKPHPDVLNKVRTTASNPAKVMHLCSVLEQDLPIAQALETVDHVYTISSFGGFEALLRGIRTTTLGLPFYAGWGLGDDRHQLNRRKRKLNIEHAFAAAYVLYPVYVDPIYKMIISAERAITRLQELTAVAQRQAVAVSPIDITTQIPAPAIDTYVLGDLNYKSLLDHWFDERKFVQIPSKTTEKEFVAKFKKRLDSNKNAEFYVVGGECAPYLKKYIEASGKKVSYLTEGFIHSVDLDTKKTPPFSLVLDRSAPHYDSRRPTDLEELLNRCDFDADAALFARSNRLLAQLLESGLSKYNHVRRVPNLQAIYGMKERPRVLVLGQVEDALSFRLANPRKYTNNDLVMIAAMENPGAQIIFKPHPNVLNELCSTASNPVKVMHLCHVLKQDLPIAQALETIDHVYTISSLGGFEALLRGLRTTTLGLPFYAGWGLGDDRQQISRRQRKLTIEQVFAVAYVMYPVYVDPLYKIRIAPSEAVLRIANESGRKENKFDDLYLNNELVLARDPAGRNTVFLLFFHPWKREFFEKVFKSYKVYFLPSNISVSKLEQLLQYVDESELIIWGYKESEAIADFIRERKIKVRRVEDGFVRSLALGSDHALPASVAIDGAHLYFDATGQSELEKILAEHDFKSDPDLLAEAEECISLILKNRVSKYNHVEAKTASEIFGEKKERRVLVIGQVEDDASIKYGCDRKILNNDLVIMARLENPDAEVFYKPHPDVLGGYREQRSDPALVECYAKVIYEPLALADALVDIDHVYTITSLAGFEALLRGIKVTAFGSPFYAGWGLTDDRQPNPRRTRKLTIVELFAGAYLLYPRYFDLVTHEPCSAKKIISDITVLRRKMDEWEALKRAEIEKEISVHPEPSKEVSESCGENIEFHCQDVEIETTLVRLIDSNLSDCSSNGSNNV